MQRILADYISDHLWHYRRISVWERVLSRRDKDLAAGDGMRWAQPEDGALLTQAGYSEVELAARSAAACRAAIAVRGDRLLGVSWYVPAAHAPRPYDWCRFALPDSAMWNIELRVSPDHEGRDLRARLMTFAHAGLVREGYRYVHVLTEHRRSEDTTPYRAAGFIRVEELIFLRIARRAFLWMGRKFGRGRWYPGNELVLPTHRL